VTCNLPSPPVCQTHNESHWQALFHHPRLSDFDGVWSAPIFQGEVAPLTVGIQNSVASSGVAVARLPHAARVDDQSLFTQNQGIIKGGYQRIASLARVFGMIAIDDRDMSVPNKAESGIKILEVSLGDRRSQNVLPDGVAWAAVYQGEPFLDNALREGLQVFQV
jgi:hypothetical protein